MFLATFLIMLREGIEAVLIISIIASYLKRTDNVFWIKYVWVGVLSAVSLCCIIAYVLYLTIEEIPQSQQELFEGIVAIAAVIVLTYMIFWMRKAARSLKSALTEQIDKALTQRSGQGLVLVTMTFFAVAREGIESLFFLFSFFEQDSSQFVAFSGALLGLVCAIILGVILYKGSIRLNLASFFKYTGVFILFIAAGLMASALKALHEAGIWNQFQTIVFDLSDTFISQNTILGTVLSGLFGFNDHPTMGEVVIYFVYLIPALLFFFWPTSTIKSQLVNNG